MPVIITGDVHQPIGTFEQTLSKYNEMSLAIQQARIANDYGLKITFFLTGKAAIAHQQDAIQLFEHSNVEIGGHGWDSLRPIIWHRFLRLAFGSPHGPGILQKRMIRNTCRILSSISTLPLRSWRNHAYRHDRNTPSLLRNEDIRIWSDRVDLQLHKPYHLSYDLTVLPINTYPDHDSMYHADHTPETPAKWKRQPSFSASDWVRQVSDQVERILASGGTATILAHPLCMYIVDEFESFRLLCQNLSAYESFLARQAAP